MPSSSQRCVRGMLGKAVWIISWVSTQSRSSSAVVADLPTQIMIEAPPLPRVVPKPTRGGGRDEHEHPRHRIVAVVGGHRRPARCAHAVRADVGRSRSPGAMARSTTPPGTSTRALSKGPKPE